MATINISRQGSGTGAVSSNFNTARTSAAASVTDGDTSSFYVQFYKSSGRGGGTLRFKRVFLYFDTSGITSTLSAAHIDITSAGVSADPNDTILLKSTAFGGDGGTALATSDFYAEIDYSTPYSSELTTWASTNNNNEYTLNAAALADIKNNDHFTLALVDHDSDYANSEPGASSYTADVYVKLATTITLDYTAAVSGYANTVNGVASANIGKVNGVATASIGKVNGI